MAFNAEQLNIVIAARTQELQKELGAAERRIKRFEGQTKANLKQTTKHFDTLGYAAKRLAPILAAAFSAQAVSNMVSTASEMGKLADIAGVGVEEFQRFAYGAKTVGIELSNASDILKDVQDRIGDFLSTGGGPMKDFFENVAPLVGVTADQFARLSGPEALQLYVSSLEKAGLSQAQMTFYMEALANDATALIPLLRSNGALMRNLGDEAQRSGRILSQDAVDGARDLEREMGDLSATIKTQLTEAILDNKDELLALVNFISGTAIPAIGGLIDKITRGIELYNAARGIDTSGFGAETDPAVRQSDVESANAMGGGDPSSTGQFYVDENGNVQRYGSAPAIPGVTAPAPPVATTESGVESTSSSRGGGGANAALEELKSKLESERELIEEYRMSEMEKLIADRDARQQILEESLQNELLTQEEYNRLKAENQRMHSEQIAKIVAAERSARLGETAQMFSALAGIAEQGGKKMVKAQAVLSGAATMIAAYEAAMKAAAEATTIPGRLAAYAAFVSKGLATVNSIKSIGASGSASSGGGGGSAAAAPAAPTVSRNVAIQLTGGSMYSRDQVVGLINEINMAVEDGATLRLV